MRVQAVLALALVGCGRCDGGRAVPVGDRTAPTAGTSNATGSYPILTFRLGHTVAFPQRERVARCRPSSGSLTFDEMKVQKLAPDRKVARPPYGTAPPSKPAIRAAKRCMSSGLRRCWSKPTCFSRASFL
jgi:hypothetical protein